MVDDKRMPPQQVMRGAGQTAHRMPPSLSYPYPLPHLIPVYRLDLNTPHITSCTRRISSALLLLNPAVPGAGPAGAAWPGARPICCQPLQLLTDQVDLGKEGKHRMKQRDTSWPSNQSRTQVLNYTYQWLISPQLSPKVKHVA